MFQKILIAEDHDANNKQLVDLLLNEFSILEVDNVMYCDDALLKFKKAHQENMPFDLLITDLSFEADHRTRQLTSGLELIEAVRKIQPAIKIIVSSMENRPSKIKQMVSNYKIDGYVPKTRKTSKELKKAVIQICNGGFYFPDELQYSLRKDNLLVLENYDKEILRYIASGNTKEEVSELFKKKDIKPASVSSIEKRLQKLYVSFNAKNTIHLIAIVQKEGLI